MQPDLVIFPVAYLLGSIPFGLLIVKAGAGRDIRDMGSGNIGAANVARSAGTFAGVLTLILDVAKGYLAVWLAYRYVGGHMRSIMAVAVFAVLGHMFPVWLKFKGGKGVATAMGVFLPICASAVGMAALLWLIVVVFWRYSSLGSIIAAAALPIFIYVLYAPGHAPPEYVTSHTVLISLLVLAKHHSNIRRLIAGDEPHLNLHK